MNIILLGAPGAGKGSISEILINEKNFFHLSTGNLLRQVANKNDELGREVCNILKAGKLVSNDIVNKILEDTLIDSKLKKYNGIIFDGYPRTKDQAEHLDGLVKIDKVLYLKVSNEIIEKRLVNRRICSNCGKIYNLEINEFKPKNPDICDVCGGLLMQRKDDQLNIIRDRLKTYYKQIEPLIEYYSNKNILFEINGDGHPDEIKKLVLNEVE